jgi:hypothetical protein
VKYTLPSWTDLNRSGPPAGFRVGVRPFLLNGTVFNPGDDVPVAGIDRVRLRQLYEQRRIQPVLSGQLPAPAEVASAAAAVTADTVALLDVNVTVPVVEESVPGYVPRRKSMVRSQNKNKG